MQGDGANTERLIRITADVGLYVDPQHDLDVDVEALRTALAAPAVELWAGTPFDMPDELAMFQLTNGGSGMAMMHAAQKAVDEHVVEPAVRHGLPVLVQGGSFAYRTKRESTQFASGFEAGVRAYGPQAQQVGERMLDLVRDWGTDHFRRGAARIVYYPAGTDITGLPGWRSVKRHGVLAISWT